MGWNGIGGNYENKTGSECVFEDIWSMGKGIRDGVGIIGIVGNGNDD